MHACMHGCVGSPVFCCDDNIVAWYVDVIVQNLHNGQGWIITAQLLAYKTPASYNKLYIASKAIAGKASMYITG